MGKAPRHEPSLTQSKGYYYLVFYDPDQMPQRKWWSLSTREQRTAERRARNYITDYMRGDFSPWDETTPVPEAQEAVQVFLQRQEKRCKPRTVETYRYTLRRFATHFEGVGLGQIAPHEVESFCSAPHARNGTEKEITNRTIERRLTEVQTMYSYFEDATPLDAEPIRSLDAPRVHTSTPPFMSREQYDTLVAHMRSYEEEYGSNPQRKAPLRYVRHATQLGVTTGLRRGSLLQLRWRHIDPINERITLNQGMAKTDGYVVPLFPEAKTVLQEIGPDRDEVRVLQTASGKQPDKYSLSRHFTRRRKEAGLPSEITFHTTRHTFASWLVQAGVPIYQVSKWMGHSDVSTTQRYAHLAPTPQNKVAQGVFSG